jgi:K+-transporting ATPase KdpF subunit
MSVFANVAGGVLGLLLVGYLFVALVKPDRF